MLIQTLLGSASSINNAGFNFQSIAAKYNKFAVILPDTVNILSGYVTQNDLPLPLVGFEVKYNSVILHNLITSVNPWTVQMITNQIFVDALEYYVQKGGTFNILTPWGDIKYAVLVGLYGIENEAGQTGVSFRLDLKTLTPVYKSEGDKLVSTLSKYITGVIL